MSAKKILVKEICNRASELSQFEKVITTSVPILEVFELRHEIKDPRIIIGKKVVAIAGEIGIKVYFVSKGNSQLYFSEHSINYRCYIPSELEFHPLKPLASVKSELHDIFMEVLDLSHIRISGVILSELTVLVEKEYDIEQFSGFPEQCMKTEEHGTSIALDEGERVIYKEPRLRVPNHIIEDKRDENDLPEVHTEVKEGINQDVTIILE